MSLAYAAKEVGATFQSAFALASERCVEAPPAVAVPVFQSAFALASERFVVSLRHDLESTSFNPRSLSRANDNERMAKVTEDQSFNPRSLSRANDTQTDPVLERLTCFNPRSLSRANDCDY